MINYPRLTAPEMLYTNVTGSSINVGELFAVGTRLAYCIKNIFGNATDPVPNGGMALICMKGIAALAKSSSESISHGTNVYWDSSLKLITATSSGNTYAGWATADAGLATTSIFISLND